MLNGGENIYLSKPDNMAITKSGVVMIQEDPGNNDHVARVVGYRIKDAKLATVAAFSSDHFAKGAAQLLTLDEESSGIIDVTSMMAKKGDTSTYFLLNAQVHTSGVIAARPDLANRSALTKTRLNNAAVEGGQFYLMTVRDWNSVFSS